MLAVGDGNLGFWAAVREVYRQTKEHGETEMFQSAQASADLFLHTPLGVRRQ
jgi:hypothetical protein